MHIYNIAPTWVWKWSIENCGRRFITQTSYPIVQESSILYSARKLFKISLKDDNSASIDFIFIETPNAQLQYVYQLHARFENDPLKTVWGWVYTISCKSCLKWLSLKGRNSSVKLNFISTKAPHAYFHYVLKMYALLKKNTINCGQSAYPIM